MRVKILIFVAFLLTQADVNAQITIEGSKVARQRETMTLVVKAPGIDDLKIQVFPKNKSWKLSRNYDDPTVIEINFTPTQDSIYYFVVSGNQDKKTLTADASVVVGDFPTPIVPDPKPKVNPYLDDITSSYLVSPDADSKKLLLGVYKEIQKGTYASWETTQLDLVAKIKEAKLQDKLVNVKKMVTSLLTRDTKDQAYSQQLKDKLFGQIVEAIETLP